GRFADEIAAGFVRGDQVAGKHTGDLLLFVEADVEQKARPDPQGDVAQLLPKWIAFGDAEGRARIADIFRAVIAHHGFETRATRHNPLWPAAEPGEEVRLDKAGDDAQIGFDQAPVEQGRGAVAGDAELNERVAVFLLVIEHAVMGDD